MSGTILPRGASTEILQSWRHGAFTLVTSLAQVTEIIEVLERPKFARRFGVGVTEIAALIRRIEATAITLDILDPPVMKLRDPDDEVILATAMTGNARFLVTGDDDLLSVDADPRLRSLRVLRPAEFLARLSSEMP